MTISGVALLAFCTLAGGLLGDLLGHLLGVKANVGGVGIAMVLLVAGRVWLARQGRLSYGVKFGIEFWGAMYIPIVVAMAADQDVVAAVKSGPVALLAAALSLGACFTAVALISRLSGTAESMDEIEAKERSAADTLAEADLSEKRPA